ncbi:MAG: carboxypeptidase-like regulatory domain-containing protein [Planctomycetota bacterium]|nr:carboxypeptidase-like regulatory domain-containing protein [Planctomycetota bacterium]MDA1214918.1 carboxypeptidase-like regulatory domain-containing protein [Planctomycetota bacterium]
MLHYTLRSSVFVLSVCLLSLISSGCGGGADGDVPDLGSVTGKVTLDGNPLADAMVEFRPGAQGRPSNGITGPDGTYTLNYDEAHPGAAVGEHTVRITTAMGAAATGATESVPSKYNEETELKVTVEAGNNTHDFDLKSE